MSDDFLSRNRAVRAGILDRIRAGVARAANVRQSKGEALPTGAATAVVFGPRPGGLDTAVAGSPALKARFIRYALASASTLEEVATRDAVPAAVARYLAGQNLPACAAIWDDLADLDWLGAGIDVAVRAANGDDPVGITGVFCGLAETGTLLLLSGPDSAPSTSLLPETHIALVPQSRLVASMEEAFALVLDERGKLPRALNFISGPSRTGDIEQTIVLGAHGPSRVHLILFDDRSAAG